MTTSGRLAQARVWANPAPTKVRIAAWSIDAVVVLGLGVITAIVTNSLVLAIIMALQVAAIMLVAEARTGATLGNILAKIRTTRDDVPYSVGMGRNAVRGAVQGAGFLVGGVGAWVVTATGMADPQRMGRTWADRAGRALVVTVPPPQELEALSGWIVENHAVVGLPTPDQEGGPVAAAPADPPKPRPPQRERVPSFGTGAHAEAFSGTLSAPLVPAQAPAAHVERAGPQILVTFDTGQRETFAIPGVINLGRRPDRNAPEDRELPVNDPDRSVSKNHLRIECRADSVWLTDLNSTNGSEIFDDFGDAVLLPPGERVRLDEGARVRVGNRSFTIATVTSDE